MAYMQTCHKEQERYDYDLRESHDVVPFDDRPDRRDDLRAIHTMSMIEVASWLWTAYGAGSPKQCLLDVKAIGTKLMSA